MARLYFLSTTNMDGFMVASFPLQFRRRREEGRGSGWQVERTEANDG